MPDCDVLTKTVLKKILEFQQNGGIVISDKNLTPALNPDILIEPYNRTGIASQDKKELLDRAEKLRETLEKVYPRYLESSNSQIIPYRRRFSETDYIFLANDNREYGKYVGHHGVVMENGLPSVSKLTVNRKSGYAYDLVAHLPVPVKTENGHLVSEVYLGPCEGQLIMITPTAIEHVNVKVPENAGRGDQKTIAIEITDANGKAIEAIIPLEINIRDAEGRILEKSGFWAAKNGKLEITIDIAPNDYEGMWQEIGRASCRERV